MGAGVQVSLRCTSCCLSHRGTCAVTRESHTQSLLGVGQEGICPRFLQGLSQPLRLTFVSQKFTVFLCLTSAKPALRAETKLRDLVSHFQLLTSKVDLFTLTLQLDDWAMACPFVLCVCPDGVGSLSNILLREPSFPAWAGLRHGPVLILMPSSLA